MNAETETNNQVPSPFKRIRKSIATMNAVLWMGLTGTLILTFPFLGTLLTVNDPLQKADAIVTLASDTYRIHHAVNLYKRGLAPVVVFTDADYNHAGLACSSAPLDTSAAQMLGLPPKAILVSQGIVYSTYDEASRVRTLAQEHNWHSIIVVTEPVHTYRAKRTFRSLMPDVLISLSAAEVPYYEPKLWWQTEEGLINTVNEVLKLGFYWVHYGIKPL